MTSIGCFKDVNFTDIPYNVITKTDALTNTDIMYCYYACSNQGMMYMAIQNSKTCACGYRYGQYGPADSTSMCVNCNSYSCGGPSVS